MPTSTLTTAPLVPFRINKDVLELLLWAWGNRIDLGGPFPLAVPGTAIEGNPAGPMLTTRAAILQEAQQLAKLDQFFLPRFLDGRGRSSPMSAFSHQSSDATKALIEVATAQELGEYGFDCLRVRVANTGNFGQMSKKPFEDRIDWVEHNLDDIIQATADRPKEDLR